MERRNNGRSKFTPRTIKKVLDALRIGAPVGTAVGAAGLHHTTWDEWVADGSELADALARANELDDVVQVFDRWMADHAEALTPVEPPQFARAALAVAYHRAKEEAVLGYVAAIRGAARDDWRAAAWWLERRRPEDFGGVSLSLIHI